MRDIENMETITEETQTQMYQVNWNSFVMPGSEKKFDKKVEQRLLPNWEYEQNVFDDEMLKSMFHWDPDFYNPLPNKTRSRSRRMRNNSNNKQSQVYDQNTGFQIYERVQSDYHTLNQQAVPDSVKQFGPPPGLTKPISQNYTTSSDSDNFSDSVDLSFQKMKISSGSIPSDEVLLKNRSAIFATDFSSDSNFSSCSDNENVEHNAQTQTSGFKLNPTAQAFLPTKFNW